MSFGGGGGMENLVGEKKNTKKCNNNSK